MKKELILEILAEGGGIDIYRSFDENIEKNNRKYQYYWTGSSMGLEDEETGFDFGSIESFDSLNQVIEKLLEKYDLLFSLYAGFVHPEYKTALTGIIKNRIAEGKLKVSEMDSLNSWLEQLNLTEEELAGTPENNEKPATKFFDGYCPECMLSGKYTEMILNKDDFWECPEDHLQIADYNYAAVILRFRGKGNFKKSKIQASSMISGNSVLVEAGMTGIFPTENIFNTDNDLKKYLSEKVKPNL